MNKYLSNEAKRILSNQLYTPVATITPLSPIVMYAGLGGRGDEKA